MTRCEFAHDDGAYVLGALAPAQRAAYERHLAGCTECGHAVAEIAVLPGLLGRLDPAGLDRLLPPPDSRLPGLLAAAGEHRNRERRATRRRYARTVLATAAVALVVGLGTAAAVWPEQPTDPAGGVEMVAMRPVAGSVPVYAEVGLVGTDWGTRVAMRCGYNAGTGYDDGARPFRLVAYGADGATEQLGSWLAAPGDDLRISGATRFTDAELVRLELVRMDGTTILAYDVP